MADTSQETRDLPQPAQDAGVAPVPAPEQTAGLQAVAPTKNNAAEVQDGDQIEPVWVHRVQQLIKQNAHDPRAMSDQLSALKAQYVKARYGKELKQGKGQE